jgi:shikimate kinase
MKNIVLIGFRKCGKTTLGKLLAKELKKTFIDTDAWIESFYFQKYAEKKTYSEIFKKHQEFFFRSLEREVIGSLEKEQEAVIATGGGTLQFEENGASLKKKGFFIFLDEEKEILRKRNRTDSFLKEGVSFNALFEERRRLYLRWADDRYFPQGRSPLVLLNEILARLYG